MIEQIAMLSLIALTLCGTALAAHGLRRLSVHEQQRTIGSLTENDWRGSGRVSARAWRSRGSSTAIRVPRTFSSLPGRAHDSAASSKQHNIAAAITEESTRCRARI